MLAGTFSYEQQNCVLSNLVKAGRDWKETGKFTGPRGKPEEPGVGRDGGTITMQGAEGVSTAHLYSISP